VKLGEVKALTMAIDKLKADLLEEQDKYTKHVKEREEREALKEKELKKIAEEQKTLEEAKGNQYYQQVLKCTGGLDLSSKLFFR
jgi:uncharacterized protein (UPF0248 family)